MPTPSGPRSSTTDDGDRYKVVKKRNVFGKGRTHYVTVKARRGERGVSEDVAQKKARDARRGQSPGSGPH